MKLKLSSRATFSVVRSKQFRITPYLEKELPHELFWFWLWWRGWLCW
jgi:hypothetical protein